MFYKLLEPEVFYFLISDNGCSVLLKSYVVVVGHLFILEDKVTSPQIRATKR